MFKSRSQSQIGQSRNLTKNVSAKTMYINEEVQKKNDKNSMQTIFHSPFKDGRPNRQYNNPTFLTSDILCRKQFNPYSSQTPQKAIIHTPAQMKQKALYNQRMNRSSSFTNLAQRIRSNSKLIKKKVKQRELKQITFKKNLRNEPAGVKTQATLSEQLEGLIKYRQEREIAENCVNNRQKYFRKPLPQASELPAYLQKHHSNPNHQQQILAANKRQLQQWLGLSQQLTQLKQQIRKQRGRQQGSWTRQDHENYRQAQNKSNQNDNRNRHLLGRILTEQVRTKQRQEIMEKREKGWKML